MAIVGTGSSNRTGWGALFAQLETSIRMIANGSAIGKVTAVDYDTSFINVELDNEPDLVLKRLPWTTQRAKGTKVYSAPKIGEKVLVVCPGGNLVNAVAVLGIIDSEDDYPEKGANIHRIDFDSEDFVRYDNAAREMKFAVANKLEIATGSGTAVFKPDEIKFTIGGKTITLSGSGVAINGNTTINGNFTLTGNATITGNITLNGTMNATGNVNAPNIP